MADLQFADNSSILLWVATDKPEFNVKRSKAQIKREQVKRQKDRLYAEQCGLCCYCGKKMLPFNSYESGRIPRNAATVEHLDNKWSGRRGNFQHSNQLRKAVACAGCNNSRGNKEWKLLDCWDFWRISGEWPDELPLIGLS